MNGVATATNKDSIAVNTAITNSENIGVVLLPVPILDRGTINSIPEKMQNKNRLAV